MFIIFFYFLLETAHDPSIQITRASISDEALFDPIDSISSACRPDESRSWFFRVMSKPWFGSGATPVYFVCCLMECVSIYHMRERMKKKTYQPQQDLISAHLQSRLEPSRNLHSI